MGVKGRRSRKLTDEPTLLSDVQSIINNAIDKGYVENYTVDIEKIVKDKGIILKKDTELSSSVSGYLKMIDKNWVIGVNAKHHPKRQRFTIAHEFAHYCLHKDDRGSFIDEEIYFRKSNDSSIEFNADRFASEILMPEYLFRDAIITNRITKINELAEKFNVSVLAIEHRAKNLNFKTKSNEK